MTQPIDLITDALVAINASAPGEPIEPSLASDAFRMLNRMLDMWSNEKMMVFYITEIIQSIGGQTAYTIGTGGQINVPRPLRINSAFVRVSTLDYQVAVISLEEYEQIGLKQLNGPWPKALYYQPKMPLGVINFWPLPATCEIHMFADTLFTTFATLNDTVTLPQGFEMAILWNLALFLLPGYGKTKDPELVAMIKQNAKDGKAMIKSTNMQPQQQVRFDDIPGPRARNDAGFILNGGFT